jgi:hypothetical protein
MSPQTVRRITDISDLKVLRVGALTIAGAVLLSSAGVFAGAAWAATSPAIRTIARITLLYLGNARG